MTYRPAESFFGPPLIMRVPSILYALIALLVVALVASAEMGPPGSALRAYMIERPHPISARAFAIMIVIGAVASILRAGMRGVRIRGDALEYRDVVSWAWPRVRRYKWAQIDRITLSSDMISLDLWDGTQQELPPVSDARGLSRVLEKVAAARAIPISGGQGLDEIPESDEFDSDED
jgi:hypothetical protein